MYRALVRLVAVFAISTLSLAANATDIPVGFLSYDVTGTNVAQFDIVNLTGPNSSGDASFPIATSVMLSNLSLTVDFIGGATRTFDSSYFTLDADGLSFDGEQLSTLAGPPTGLFNAIDATLTGTFSPGFLTLFDGSMVSIAPGFSVSIGGGKQTLQDGDLGVINSVETPEPATWTMLGTGLIGLVSLAGAGAVRRLGRSRPDAGRGVALSVGFALLMIPASSKAVTVKLNSLTSPATGAAGASTVSVTGSGFPSGTISLASVFVSLAATCGGSPTTTTTSTVQKILGTTARISFAVPGSLAAGTYFVSVNGIDSNEVDFTSGTSCSTLQVVAGPSPTLTIDTTNAADWKIGNGALSIDFNPQGGNIFSLFPAGTMDNLIDLTNVNSHGPKGFYMDNAGFGTVTGVPGFVNTGGYIDWWVTYPSSSANAYTYSEHWVVTPNDPAVHVYFVADHSASDIAGSTGQVQWVVREDLNKFPNIYSVNPDLSNPGPIAIPLPSASEYFSTDPGRAVQDATVDLHGFTDIPAGFKRFFGDKYDYSGYTYLNVAHGVYGSQYGAWVVFPSNESMVGGPTKQDLLFTGNLDMIEPYSNHLDNALSLASPAGVATHRLYGPFYVRFNKFGGNIQTPDDMYKDAVIAGTSFGNFYDHEAQLVAAGYVPSTARGTVQVQVNGIASGVPKTAWAVLSDPGKNIQFSGQGAQYWMDISTTGTATFNGVIPGTYRLSVYDLGQWGEVRQENITVAAGQNTVVPPFNFVQENFGAGVPLFTIGTADRSSHEFLHGHDAAGHDDREFWGNWNYWADFAANQGAVIYNAADGPAGSATNDLSKWNYNQWQTFDPGLYGGVFNSADDTTDGYTFAIPAYVAALPSHAGTNGVTTRTPPWTVHFATPQNAGGNAFAVLSVALAAAEASLTVTLNGQPLVWHVANASDAAVRSGLSGYTQWIVYQWDSSVLKPTGGDNVLTFSVSQTQGVEWDALRMELTNASADPAITGWHDYEFLYNATDTKPNDAVPNP
jgi:rhamnogalacturonan endolyase